MSVSFTKVSMNLNDISMTMTDAVASDASVWIARLTCHVVLEKM